MRANKSSIGAFIAPEKVVHSRDFLAENRALVAHIGETAKAVDAYDLGVAKTAAESFKLKKFQDVPSKLSMLGLGHTVAQQAPAASSRQNTGGYSHHYDSKAASMAEAEREPVTAAAAAAYSREQENRAPREDRHAAARALFAAEGRVIPKKFTREEMLPRKPAVPKATETISISHEPKDFLARNAVAVISRRAAESGVAAAAAAAAVDAAEAWGHHPSAGGVGSPARSTGAGSGSAGKGSPSGSSVRAGGINGSLCSTYNAQHHPQPQPFLHSSGMQHLSGRAGSAAGGKAAIPKHEEYGKVPQYLKARQAEWAEEAEAKRKAAEEADVPPGHRLMPESERVEMLAMLRESERETQEALGKFKLNLVVASQRQRKAEMEAKLTKVEEAIRTFSRSRVFVKI